VLRIPDGKLASSLTELRKLGQPKEESQNSADVTGQYVDLVARLSNARNTEQRLLTLLRDRTGNLKDVVAAEGEIARVRESIERMEAERKNFDNKVQYATIQVELSEEYHAQLQQTLPNTRTRIYNAAVEGYESASDTILGIALTILAVGPAALVWLAFLGCMGFLVWRLYVLLRSRQRSHAIHSV
jgi:nitrate reductase NapE component